MNREYYYFVNDEQRGPLSIDKLKLAGIKPDTLIWAEGMIDWAPAEEVEGLEILFNKRPPIPSNKSIPSTSSTPNRSISSTPSTSVTSVGLKILGGILTGIGSIGLISMLLLWNTYNKTISSLGSFGAYGPSFMSVYGLWIFVFVFCLIVGLVLLFYPKKK